MKKTLLAAALVPITTGFGGMTVAEAGASVLEEVIVTARKREQSLQDVSLAVTAIPSSILEDALIGNSADLVNLVPSLNLQGAGQGRSTSFNIRGIGTQSFCIADTDRNGEVDFQDVINVLAQWGECTG